MINLQLSLKTKWFDMTKAKIKPEDYREITPYWISRLTNNKFETKDKSLIVKLFKELPKNWVEFKSFDTNIMTLGYPKSGDTERIIKYEHAGIEIRTGNPEWGAETDKLYFVIKHGKELTHQKIN